MVMVVMMIVTDGHGVCDDPSLGNVDSSMGSNYYLPLDLVYRIFTRNTLIYTMLIENS